MDGVRKAFVVSDTADSAEKHLVDNHNSHSMQSMLMAANATPLPAQPEDDQPGVSGQSPAAKGSDDVDQKMIPTKLFADVQPALRQQEVCY